jgi:hypothetical protein
MTTNRIIFKHFLMSLKIFNTTDEATYVRNEFKVVIYIAIVLTKDTAKRLED